MTMRMALVCLVLAACAGSAPPPQSPTPAAPASAAEEPTEVPGMPAGYVEGQVLQVADVGDGGAVLLLDESSNRIVPIFIGGTEAASIQLRMRGEPPQRPLTHDLLDTIVKKLHASIVKVQVDELRDGTYIGSVFVRDGRRIYRIDARPSDAMALAIGNKVPIYVAKKVIEEAGVPRDEIMRQVSPQGVGPTT